MSTIDFYDALAPVYHLIYPDWSRSIDAQGRALDSIIRSRGGATDGSVLDAACGIGTQSLGLARLGYAVTASDISPAAVKRAQLEADQRGVHLRTKVADMLQLAESHDGSFDIVIACDNSIPHLLSDENIRAAFDQFFRCTKAGGLCLISVRDYDVISEEALQFHPYGVREERGKRYILFQVWNFVPPLYETTFYVVEHVEAERPITTAVRATYYAVSINKLIGLMEAAGFTAVERLDEPFFQPVIVGSRPAAEQ